jgi:hypothetical protein
MLAIAERSQEAQIRSELMALGHGPETIRTRCK